MKWRCSLEANEGVSGFTRTDRDPGWHAWCPLPFDDALQETTDTGKMAVPASLTPTGLQNCKPDELVYFSITQTHVFCYKVRK